MDAPCFTSRLAPSKRPRQVEQRAAPRSQEAPDRGCSPPLIAMSLRRTASAPLGESSHRLFEELEDLNHWRLREATLQPSAELMLKCQSEVTSSMRWILVDWLGEVRDEYKLGLETLFLAVRLVDRFLCAKPIACGRFQLLGLACLWVASKYEEVCAPSARQMLAMAEHMYTGEDIRAMEKELLFTLGFELACPTSLRFLHYLLLMAPLPASQHDAYSVRRLSEALLELSQLDAAYLRAPPSAVAAAALYLALGLTANHACLPGLMAVGGVDAQLLGALVKDLANTLSSLTTAGATDKPAAVLGSYLRWQRWAAARLAREGAQAVAVVSSRAA